MVALTHDPKVDDMFRRIIEKTIGHGADQFLVREVLRFHRARRRLGEIVMVESSGVLRSVDGDRSYPLRDGG